VASAAEWRSGELLLRFLNLAGWTVDVRDAPVGLSALAVRGSGSPRVAAWGRNRTAVALLLFHATCVNPPVESALS
jgi:hypothetical protein